jgi:hypothetical protein
MQRILSIIAVVCVLCAPAAAETIFYLNFDDTSGGPFADGTTYTPGASEVVRPSAAGLGNVTFTFRNNAGDGALITTPAGGLTGTAQGGNALLVDSCGGQDEGLQLTVDNGLAPQDFTLEVLWYTVDAACSGNTAGIQSMCGDEWPFGEVSQFFIRTVNVGTTRMDYWTDRGDSNGENVMVDPGGYAANTWHHDVIVFDYNEATPASSSMEAFRDGVSVGTSPYDASGASVSLFGSALAGARTFAIGFHNSLDANAGDHRGLSGGVDAWALSTGVLVPGSGAGTFVLPDGADLPVDLDVLY